MSGLQAMVFCRVSAATALILGLAFPPVLWAGTTDDVQAFAVSGVTSRPVLANAEVEVRVGAAAFAGLTDAAGRFEVEANCPGSPDDLVYVIIRGLGAQSELHLARVLDGCGRLQSLADEHGRYQTGPVNQISTGMYAAIRWFAEREQYLSWPMTASELLQAQYLLGGEGVAIAAEAIAYWEAGLGTRPWGIDNTLDLVLDRPAMFDYASKIQWNQRPTWVLEDIAREVFWDPAHFRRPLVQDGASLATAYPELLRSRSEWFRFSSDGRFQFGRGFDASSGYWRDLSRQDRIMADAFERRSSTLRTLELTPDPGSYLWVDESLTTVWVPGQGWVNSVRRTVATQARVSVVEASDLIPLLSVQYDTLQSFPEFPEIPVVETRDAVPSLHNGILDFEHRPAWSGPQVGQQWVLPILSPELPPQTSPMTATRIEFLNETTAVLSESRRELQWAFEDQVLILVSAELGEHRLYFLGQAEGRHPIFFVKAELDSEPNVHVRVETRAGFQPTPSAGAWQAEQVAGRYVSGFSLDAWLPPSPYFVDPFFVFDLNADGSGWVGDVPAPDAPLEFAHAVNWSIDAHGGLILSREFSNGDFRQWRRWERLSDPEDSDVIYLRESTPLWVEGPIDEPPDFSDYRINFYQLRQIPD